MTPSFGTDLADLPVDRWAIRLDEPPAGPVGPVVSATNSDDADGVFLPFTFTMDVPSDEFQPRLSRFDEAA